MARYDIPEEIVSDSGLQFRSNEFKAFAKNYGFKLTHSLAHTTINQTKWLNG